MSSSSSIAGFRRSTSIRARAGAIWQARSRDPARPRSPAAGGQQPAADSVAFLERIWTWIAGFTVPGFLRDAVQRMLAEAVPGCDSAAVLSRLTSIPPTSRTTASASCCSTGMSPVRTTRSTISRRSPCSCGWTTRRARSCSRPTTTRRWGPRCRRGVRIRPQAHRGDVRRVLRRSRAAAGTPRRHGRARRDPRARRAYISACKRRRSTCGAPTASGCSGSRSRRRACALIAGLAPRSMSGSGERAPHYPTGRRRSRCSRCCAGCARRCRCSTISTRRYGPVFTLRQMKRMGGPMVFFSEPSAVRDLWTGDPHVLRAGEANIISNAVLGGEFAARARRRSPHPRAPPHDSLAFHGERMRAYGETMRDATTRAIDTLAGRASRFPVHESMQAITLDVIMRTIFGVGRRRDLGALYDLARAVDGPPGPRALAPR